MNLWEMILGIVLISAIATTLQVYLRKQRGTSIGDIDDMDARQLIAEVKTLRERVAVLERIATDRNHALEHEFEKLRDS